MATNNPARVAKPESEHRTFERPWNSDSKIAVGIHIGSTHSGVTFTFLTRGCRPVLRRVTRWPCQESFHSDPKVPSLIWYDRDNKPTRFGAEALSPEAEREAEDNEWRLAKYFSMQLHPDDLKVKHSLMPYPLPSGVFLSQIYSDFLRYLFQHTQRSFETDIINGKELWRDHHRDMDIVIGHANGHGIREQEFLRSAAISAGIVASEKALRHIRFVSEAEAWVRFCLHHVDLESPLPMTTKVALCIAGGSTVDTTIYNIQGTPPALRLREACASECVQAGAIFVDAEAERYLRNLFTHAGLSPEEVDEYTHEGAKDFEANVKRVFHEVTGTYHVQISGARLNIPRLRVRRGRLILEGSIIQSFFDLCVGQIIASINSQISSTPVSQILLTGSFADSPYLLKRLRDQFEPMGAQVTLVSVAGIYAPADGAVLWYHASQFITKSVSRCAYGTEIDVPFDQTHAEHSGRAQFGKLGGTHVNGKWFPLVPKGVPIEYDDVRRQTHTREYSGPDVDLGSLNEELYAYYPEDTPGWLKNKSGELLNGFLRVCSVTANLGGMRKALQPRINACGAQHWALTFNVCFLVGGAELEAFIEWVEEETIRTMPANITHYNLLL